MNPDSAQTSIHSIVLAAGQARRFGATKLLAQVDGTSLLGHALSAAQSACPGNVCLVVGHRAADILREAPARADIIAENADYHDGIGSSIACGVRACRASADAVVVMLADQPTINARHVRALIDAWSGKADEIVVSTHAGTQAPPTLFGKGVFEELSTLSGDHGARRVMQSDAYAIRTVAFAEPVIDIDTEDDLRKLTS